MGNTLVIKTLDATTIKGYKYIEAVCLITLCYFLNTYPINISNLVLYWAVNNILDGVDSIKSGINPQ